MTIRFGVRLAAVLALVLAMGLLAACGDDDDDDDAGQATATTAPTTPADQATPTSDDDDDDDDNGDDDDDDAEAGRQIAAGQCFSCHTTDGSTGVGPSWQGLYGSEVELESGETVEADEDYIRESILDPNAKVHAGFPAVMPSFEGQFTDDQIDQIIAYIRSLE